MRKTPSQIEITLSQTKITLSPFGKETIEIPREARKESITGIYHVMTRGLNKLPVFKEQREKTRMLNLIRENISKYDVEIYAYCIMPNHFHLLIKADLQELASFMAKILAAYAKYYNYKHNRIGYVFQSRYKSQCIETEKYFWNCCRYIHMNPAKEGNLDELLSYKYSSMMEMYSNKKDVLAEKIFILTNEKFMTKQDFLEFHRSSSWDVYEDVEEEILINNMRIANELLEQYELQFKVSKLEIIDYIGTRNRYEKELTEILKISKPQVLKLIKKIRKSLKGTG